VGIYRRPDSLFWWMKIEGTPLRLSTGVPVEGGSPALNKELKRQAQEIYAARTGDAARGRHGLTMKRSSAPTFEKFAAWYEQHVAAKHRGADREREILATLTAAFRSVAIDRVSRRRVEEWTTVRAKTVSPRTVNREVDLLKSILRKAAELGHLQVSPLLGMKRLRAIAPKRRLLSPAEERRLLAVADQTERALLILGMDTLVRLGDLLDVRRTDRRGAWLYIRDPKNPTQGEPYEVPLSLRAQRALGKVPYDGPYYFERFRTAKKARDWRGSVRQMLERLSAAADVPFGKAEAGITFHWATRRTGATRLIRKGVDVKTVQEIGHWKRSDVVLEIYSEADKHGMLKAVGGLQKRRR
jgi:site-specific recombinase XerD